MALLKFEDCELDTETGDLSRGGVMSRLGHQCVELISFLYQNRDRVVRKDEIIDALWNGAAVSDAALSTAIKEARSALGDDGKSQRVIRTIHRRGFQFVGKQPEPKNTAAQRTPPAKLSTDQRIPRVSVQAFSNLSGDPEETFFAEGIAQDILTELSRFNELQVIAPASSIYLRKHVLETDEAERQLNADFVVSGSVRRSNDRVRLSAHLIDSHSGSHVWVERYDRPLENVFEIQDEIARSVARGVNGRVARAIVRKAKRSHPKDLTAYYCVLRAQWCWWHEHDLETVFALLDEAIERDPNFARAYAMKGMFQANSIFEHSSNLEQSTNEFLDCMKKAVSLDDGDASIHAFTSLAYLFAGNHTAALNHSRLAMEINPNSVDAVHYRAAVLGTCGAPVEALNLHKIALEMDPFHPEGYYEAMLESYYLVGDYDEAIKLYYLWRNPPAHVHLEAAACYAQVGDTEGVAGAIAKFEDVRPADFEFAAYLAAVRRLHLDEADVVLWLDGFRKAGLNVD